MSARFDRLAVAGLLGATGVAGLLFTPVFGWGELLVPVLVVVLVAYGCVELTAKFPKLTPYRPLFVALLGLLGLIETVLTSTTLAFLPTGASLRGLARGLTEGWQLTLQSTWPARPVPEQLLFVPLSVLLAVVLGLELLLHLRKPLVALVPSLAVAVLAQAYQALTGVVAVAAALGYALPAGLLLWSGRRVRPERRAPGGPRPSWRVAGSAVWPALSTVVALVAGAVALAGLDPVGRDPLTLKDTQAAPPPRSRVGNPLDEIAQRLTRPGEEVFRYRGDAPVDQWRLIVLNGFDGANWLSDSRLRRLGAGLDGAPGGAGGTAELRVRGLSGPWLPSHQDLTGVDGLTPLVDQSAGTLMLESPSAGPERNYRLSWSSPEVDLGSGEVDARAVSGLGGLGTVPPDVEQVARDAVRGLRPTFQSALQLERFLSTNYQVAAGTEELPTGHGWPQLRHFLLESKRGTSEQFAAAYVVLARMNGIPARLVVGFRGSAETDGDMHVVRNRDVLAWPEVAVDGAGWVALDPTAAAGKAGRSQAGPGKAVARARAQLPAEQQLRPPQLPPGTQSETAEDQSADAGMSWWWPALVAAIVLFGLLWLLGVPAAKVVRARRRRRRSGAEGVLGAWDEIRDRLRAHGVPFRIGMTPRDLAESAGSLAGEGIREPVARLAKVLDVTLWSGVPVGDGAVRRAWQEVGEVRRGLATRPFAARVLAALEPRTLVPIKGRASREG
ncbi:transglutaminase TgpA family protein [Amycolatopsis decaplanina]|uniref:Transglutaminase domain-containing protein n=1 Tax=Amycolatopsis decaplanina DSM 44594 TaxID=1284240 RepID=M2ZCB5_9PSEU|nr:transglutaminaseTgpA domain-containing protein [Amycolatopsis decaplanina]EME58543.1 transglutaminase domain-containing protein [Amycolatopsis decaplanina DSM 44594]